MRSEAVAALHPYVPGFGVPVVCWVKASYLEISTTYLYLLPLE